MRFGSLGQWLAWQEGLHPKQIDLGLDRVSQVYRRLGSVRVPIRTITVGGTNGKGSAVAYLTSILCAAGYRVGSYTSPHLLRYNERICINRAPVSDELLCRTFDRIDRARGDTTLSFFEFGTLAALEIFSEAELDVQVLEVGLGGRLDAVNMIDADAVLLTSIAMDHQDWLGGSREQIGVEKAGVMRPQKPAVTVDPDPPASMLEYARSLPAFLAVIGRQFEFRETSSGWDWTGSSGSLKSLPRPPLPGIHQLRNASGAIEVLASLADLLPVSEAAIRQGLCETRLNARFKVIDAIPPIVLDVAHNVQAVGTLSQLLRQTFSGHKVHAVFALMRDKDLEGVIREINDLVVAWYLPPLRTPRATPPSIVGQALIRCGAEKVEWRFDNAADAVTMARRSAKHGELVVVFGSFFLVAECLVGHEDWCE